MASYFKYYVYQSVGNQSCRKMCHFPGQNHGEIVCFSNSNEEDPVSRISISGFILYVLGVPVCWQSKLQKYVSLSSSEMEYIALSKIVEKVLFVIQLLGCMKMLVKYPVMV